ncbi:MAG: TonB-dependent receptor, partial [Daejeonella sp.]|nr:TonB-dependent receptor [Daejeonella sp.]
MKLSIQRHLLFSLFVLTTTACLAQVPKRPTNNTDTTAVKRTELQEVVVTASRTSESLLRSPVSIEKITSSAFNRSAAPSFFDALENVKGVQMITPSLGFRIINTRGFA